MLRRPSREIADDLDRRFGYGRRYRLRPFWVIFLSFFRRAADFLFGWGPTADAQAADVGLMPDQRERSFTATCFYNSWVLAFGVGLFIINQMVDEDKYPTGSHLLEEATVAFAIAYLIIITIEYRSRRELNYFMEDFTKKSHENFFQVVLGLQFPVKMFELVKNYIMQERVHRQNTEVHFTIRRQKKPNFEYGLEIVDIEMFCSFDITNLSDRPYDYAMPFFFDNRNLPDMTVDGVKLTEQELQVADEAGPTRVGFRCNKYALHLDRLGSRKIAVRTYTTRLIADTMVWQSVHACDGLRVSVTHPPELAVRLNSIHPDSFELVEKNEFRQIAKISCPLFPANGFSFWWVPTAGAPRGDCGESKNEPLSPPLS